MITDESQTASRPPTLEELKECDSRARECIGQPEIYAWKYENKPSYLLTVTYGAGSVPPTWILHAGEGDNAAVVWIAVTTELQEVLTKLKRAVQHTSSFSINEIARAISENAAEVNPDNVALKKGAIFATNYEIMSQIGHGGMGTVYKARQMDTNEHVALKVLHPHLVTDNLSRARFEQEAQKSGLTHRNLIRIRKSGFSAAGQPFIAMDFLDGCPLTDLLGKGPLGFGDFTTIFSQVCEGLYHAHSKGVIHRDIKPGNIMICRDDNNNPVVKIVDFGIAKSNILSGEDSKLTPTGEVLGSPLYMSPEQCAGAAPDPRSDIYSLGCVMYEAATGLLAFNHANPIKLILMQISERPPSFLESMPDGNFSKEQEKIVMKALEKDPSKRYQTAEELGRDLWQLTVTGRSGAVRSFGGDLKKSQALVNSALLSPSVTDDLVDAFKSAGKPKKMVTFRFRKFKASFEKDLILRGLDLSLRLLKKGADLSIYLDYETAHLVHKSNLMAPEFHSDLSTTERIQSIQTSFQRIIKAGGSVTVSEHWLRYYGILAGGPDALISGIIVMDDDQQAEYLLERTSSFLDYT